MLTLRRIYAREKSRKVRESGRATSSRLTAPRSATGDQRGAVAALETEVDVDRHDVGRAGVEHGQRRHAARALRDWGSPRSVAAGGPGITRAEVPPTSLASASQPRGLRSGGLRGEGLNSGPFRKTATAAPGDL